jgi:hypothetical protein
MAVGPVVLPTSGYAAWDDLATWSLSRYKVSTQQTYATYLRAGRPGAPDVA